MSQADKVGHVPNGIADDAFNLLVYKNGTTVDVIIMECRGFEQAKSRRIAPNFIRLKTRRRLLPRRTSVPHPVSHLPPRP